MDHFIGFLTIIFDSSFEFSVKFFIIYGLFFQQPLLFELRPNVGEFVPTEGKEFAFPLPAEVTLAIVFWLVVEAPSTDFVIHDGNWLQSVCKDDVWVQCFLGKRYFFE